MKPFHEAIANKKTPLCVGIDPQWDLLPEELKREYGSPPEPDGRHGPRSLPNAFEVFGRGVIDAAAPHVGIVKFQSAFFEAAGYRGLHALGQLICHAKRKGLAVILDNKRGDTPDTAAAYAYADFDAYEDAALPPPDAVTVNPYLGEGCVRAFVDRARARNKGVFVVAHPTSPGFGSLNRCIAEGKTLAVHVADMAARIAEENVGGHGYGDVGVVIAGNLAHRMFMEWYRQQYPKMYFLVPGFGSQGGFIDHEIRVAFNGGFGSILNISRSILYPAGESWREDIAKAVARYKEEIATAMAP